MIPSVIYWSSFTIIIPNAVSKIPMIVIILDIDWITLLNRVFVSEYKLTEGYLLESFCCFFGGIQGD